MEVVFYRQGFANNSSSSHSIIFANDFDSIRSASSYDENNFGWEQFKLKDVEEKRMYLLLQLRQQIQPSFFAAKIHYTMHDLLLKNFVKTTMRGEMEIEMTDEEVDLVAEGNIDHESAFTFPMDLNNPEKVHVEFFKKFMNELCEKNYVFFGGNDNGGSNDAEDYGYSPAVLRLVTHSTPLCMKDENSDQYILVDPHNGDEVRVVFDEDKNSPSACVSPERSYVPSLVDLSLGDYCDAGCSFCYTDSTKKGSWAEFKQVRAILRDLLQKGGARQVVLGGGEPTKHPELYNIIHSHAAKKMNLSITTRNYDWHLDPQFASYFRGDSPLKSVAISVTSESDVVKAAPLARTLLLAKVSVTMQTVVGLVDSDFLNRVVRGIVELSQVIKEDYNGGEDSYRVRDLSITFLGWKSVGRGDSGPPFPNADWLTAAQYAKEQGISVATDAALSSQHEEELKEAGVPTFRIAAKEGQYSCYIDALHNYIRKCSYEGEKYPILEGEDLHTLFQKV
jgi:hypothetical protein